MLAVHRHFFHRISTFLEKDQPWPMNRGKAISSELPLMTGSYGPNQLGRMVDNVFYINDGFVFQIDQNIPADMRRTENSICCRAKKDPENKHDLTHILSLVVDLLAAPNIEAATQHYSKIHKNYYGHVPDER